MPTDEYEYAEIANSIFTPIFEPTAQLLLRETGIHHGKLLDIGCGVGHLGLTVLKHHPLRATFVDIHPEAVLLCKEKAEEWKLSNLLDDVLLADVHAMPFADDSFNLIISRGSSGFWKDTLLAFTEIYRVLAPGGKTFIGSGLGNKETRAQVNAQMRARNPDWPNCVKDKQNKMTTGEYCSLFTEKGWPYRVYENEDEGRWFILEKPA